MFEPSNDASEEFAAPTAVGSPRLDSSCETPSSLVSSKILRLVKKLSLTSLDPYDLTGDCDFGVTLLDIEVDNSFADFGLGLVTGVVLRDTALIENSFTGPVVTLGGQLL